MNDHEKNLSESKYYRLKPIMKEALALFDYIRRDFRDVYNGSKLGTGGALDIVEQSHKDRKFSFPFGKLAPSDYRLTKGAAYPIFAAFRNKVEIDPATGAARWKGGFESVLKLWKTAAPEICRETKNAIKDIGRKPDQLGKNRGHWSNMHRTVEVFILRAEKAASK